MPLRALRWPAGKGQNRKQAEAVADALLWIMGQHGVKEAMHYLDDFLVFGSPGSQKCEKALDISSQLCKQLGVLVAPLQRHDSATFTLGRSTSPQGGEGGVSMKL